MHFLTRTFNGALFCLTYISCASSLSGDNLFSPTDDLDNGNIQYASLPDMGGDSELLSHEGSASLFSFNDDLGSSIPISQNWDSAVLPNNDPASVALFSEDAPLPAAFDAGSALALNDLPLPSLSGELQTLASNVPFETSEFDAENLSDIDCMSYEEQTVGKSRRGDVCGVTDAGKRSFPPPYANPGRFNWLPENDPKRRPAPQLKNSKADFVYCPSGPGGYRMYLICDSGREADRSYTAGRGITLVNLDVERNCMLLFSPQICAQTADSQTRSFSM